MRFAVKDRPIEKFDTDLKLPDWQLEPDDEFLYGDPGDYYYIDENGNLIEPSGPQERRNGDLPLDGAHRPARRAGAGQAGARRKPGTFWNAATGTQSPQSTSSSRDAEGGAAIRACRMLLRIASLNSR